MIIFRAGLTGCLAGVINSSAKIIDPSSGPVFHKAVLRFRSDDISRATGIPFKEIKVTKHIVSKGKFTLPNPMLCNNYSFKVIGGRYNRSINNLEPVTRWLAPENFHEQLIELCKERIQWDTPIDIWKYDEPMISTMPMFELAKLLNVKKNTPELTTQNNSIYVTTLVVENCDVHQTIYYPDVSDSVYRATLERNKIIIESIDEICKTEIERVLENFGIHHADLIDSNYKQQIGKIAPIDEEFRKEFIFNATHNHGIYSLGRTAVWRNILLDDCLKDIRRINEMIAKSKYDKALGK